MSNHGVLISHLMLAQFFIVDLLTASRHLSRSRISTSDQPVRLGSMPAPDSFVLALSVQLDRRQLSSRHSIVSAGEASIFLRAATLR